jgi:TolA-binding protein
MTTAMPFKKSNSEKEIIEIRRRLIDYIQRTTENFSLMNDRLDKIQAKVEKLPDNMSSSDDAGNVDRLHEMEFQIAQMSKEVSDIRVTVKEVAKSQKEAVKEVVKEAAKSQKEAVKEVAKRKHRRSHLNSMSLKYLLKPPSKKR